MQLKFRKDGTFKILAVADLQDTNHPQRETTDMLVSALNQTDPDLVIFLGDNIAGWWDGVDPEQTKAAIRRIVDPVDQRGIPFAVVFGNHDHEGLTDENNQMTETQAKKFQMQIYREYHSCLAAEGEEMTGVGNYNLLIRDSLGEKDIFNLWLMDSNTYAPEGGYGYVQPDQTDWYIRTSNKLKKANGGVPLPSLLFQHICVPEVYALFHETGIYTPGAVKGHTKLYPKFYTTTDRITQGGLKEAPCSADTAHSQFRSWKRQGDIIGAFFGHDHPNDYTGCVDGIRLTAVPAAGYYSYGNHHGVRTVILSEKDLCSFESELFHAEDLLDYRVKPFYKSRHGWYEYQKKFLPAAKKSSGRNLRNSGRHDNGGRFSKKKKITVISQRTGIARPQTVDKVV